MIAPDAVPTVIAGSSTRRNHSTGFSVNGTYPDGGSQPSVVENTRMRMMPIQKSGTETPNWLITRTITSENFPG